MSNIIDSVTRLNIFQQTSAEPNSVTASNTRAEALSPTVAHTYSCTTLRMSQKNDFNTHSFNGHGFSVHNFSGYSFVGYTGNRGTGVDGRS